MIRKIFAAGYLTITVLFVCCALVLTAWGLFVKLNRSVEELEPEAMERAMSEDHKVE